MELSAVIWMFVILKIPVLAALWVVWYALKAPDPAIEEPEERGGGSDREPGPSPRRPRPPRRGPHGAVHPPPRVRAPAPARPQRRVAR